MMPIWAGVGRLSHWEEPLKSTRALPLRRLVLSYVGAVLALFMGAFLIFNTFRTVVAERRRDIGMLRALGAKRTTITGMILIEGVLQGLIGSVFFVLAGFLIA